MAVLHDLECEVCLHTREDAVRHTDNLHLYCPICDDVTAHQIVFNSSHSERQGQELLSHLEFNPSETEKHFRIGTPGGRHPDGSQLSLDPDKRAETHDRIGFENRKKYGR